MSQQSDSEADGSEIGEPGLLSSPLIRITIGVVIVAVVVACGGFIVLSVMQIARGQPIEVEVYPGARLDGHRSVGRGQDQLLYTTGDDAEAVAAFYRERYGQDQDQDCVRHDAPRDADTGALLDPTRPAFEVVCGIDNSIVNAHQSAIIRVQPHTVGEYTGLTVIYIERFWQE
jgi:hypothetical protein